MSDVAQGPGDARAGTSAKHGGALGVLLECFNGIKAAGKARRGLDAQLKAQGDALLDTVVLQVNAKHKASVHDPRRVVQGTLTATLTWGLFGLVAGGLKSAAIWAIFGAICGGLWAYYTEHLLRKDELARIGAQLPASSSALVTFAKSSDPRSLLKATADHAPAAASVAAVDDDLGARVFAGPTDPIEVSRSPGGGVIPPGRTAPTSMIMLRYPSTGTAKQVAAKAAPTSKKAAAASPVQVELVIWADSNGRRHVADPSQGVKAWAKADLISWGLFGLVVGALAGAFGGGGVHSFVSDAVVTGIGWAVFGLAAGALYGLWAGRAVSARRLKGLSGLLAPGSSILIAWADGPVSQDTIDTLTAPGSQRLILRFNAVDGGAVLEAA
jgi:membrane associated rhomboid family serine protease